VKLDRLNIRGFGVWRDFALEDISGEAEIIYGENEAGKTTLLEFVRAVLYGLSPAREKYLPPVSGGRPGGELTVNVSGGRYEVCRYFEGPVSRAEIRSQEGAVRRLTWDTLLGDIDEATFNNVFAVGLRELQELATLNDTEAGALLYNLASGFDRVSLVDVSRNLQRMKADLVGTKEKPGKLGRLSERRDELKEELRILSLASEEWLRLAGQHAAVEREIEKLERDSRAYETESRRLDLARAILPRWQEREKTRKRLTELATTPDVPAGAVARLTEINEQIDGIKQTIAGQDAEMSELTRQAKAIPLNEKLWRETPRIEALADQRGWFATLAEQAETAEHEARRLEAELAQRKNRSGVTATPEKLGALRGPLREYKETGAEVKRLRRRLAESEREEAAQRQAAADSLAEQETDDLNEALKRAGQRVSLLRRRAKCEDRLAELEEQAAGLREEGQSLVERVIAPPWVLLALGIFFSCSAVLLGMGGFSFILALAGSWDLATQGIFLMLLGFVGIVGTYLLRQGYERQAARQLDEVSEQLRLAEADVDDAEEELHAIESRLPYSSQPLDEQLAGAQKELEELEQLVPLETQRQATQSNSHQIRQEAAAATRRMKAAQEKWRAQLRALGLSPRMRPSQAVKLIRSAEKMSELTRRAKSLREEADDRRGQITALADRVRNTATGVGVEILDIEDAQPLVIIDRLLEAIAANEASSQERERLREEIAAIRKRRSTERKKLKQSLIRKKQTLKSAKVASEAELSHRLALHEEAGRLRTSEEELTLEFLSAIDDVCSEDEIEQILHGHDEAELDARYDAVLADFDRVHSRLKSLYERRGGASQQMKTMVEGKRLQEAQFELACITRQLTDAVDELLTIDTALAGLHRVKSLYETSRQPATLMRASEFLAMLTRGRYLRVWTPLTEETVRVEDAKGQSLPVDVLSTGAREQVFLALRLALIENYAERGVRLPVILDDVLVNFDEIRAKSAIETLCEFAKSGHQLLFYTCHLRLAEMFRERGVNVRRLPARGGTKAQTLRAESVSNSQETRLASKGPSSKTLIAGYRRAFAAKRQWLAAWWPAASYVKPRPKRKSPPPEPRPTPPVPQPDRTPEPTPIPEDTWFDLERIAGVSSSGNGHAGRHFTADSSAKWTPPTAPIHVRSQPSERDSSRDGIAEDAWSSKGELVRTA